MKVWKVTICEGATPYLADRIEDVLAVLDSEIRDADIGNALKVETLEMDKETFDALPERTGP